MQNTISANAAKSFVLGLELPDAIELSQKIISARGEQASLAFYMCSGGGPRKMRRHLDDTFQVGSR